MALCRLSWPKSSLNTFHLEKRLWSIVVGSILYRLVRVVTWLWGMWIPNAKLASPAILLFHSLCPRNSSENCKLKQTNLNTRRTANAPVLTLTTFIRPWKRNNHRESLFSEVWISKSNTLFCNWWWNGAGKSTHELGCRCRRDWWWRYLVYGQSIRKFSVADRSVSIVVLFQDPRMGTATNLTIEENSGYCLPSWEEAELFQTLDYGGRTPAFKGALETSWPRALEK